MVKVFDGGRVLPAAMRNASGARGRILITQERDEIRSRFALVARFHIAGAGFRALPPLYDAALVSASDSTWAITGHERVISGVMRDEYFVTQTWLASPAPLEDLRKAEQEWQRLLELIETMKAGQVNGPS